MSLRFSQELNRLLIKLSVKPISIAEILRQTGERGFCLVISLLVLPFLFPMPPGLSGIMGLGCFILGGQMALGRKYPWMPKRVARFKFPRRLSRQLLKSVRRLITWLEKIVRSRWLGISKHPYAWRGNGLCIAWLSILLMLPIPFTNPLPAIAILFLTIATIEFDGLLMCVGYLLSLFNTVFFGFMGYLFWQLPHIIPNFLK